MDLTRDAVLKHLGRGGPAGMRALELADAMGLDRRGRAQLGRVLDELVAAGDVDRTGGRRFRLRGAPETALPTDRERAVAGIIRVHPAGYGFVVREDGLEDVFVGARHRGLALDSDRVTIVTWPGRKGTEGRVTSVLTRGRAKLTGILRSAGHAFFLEPDDPRLPGTVALEEGAGGAREGQAVLAEILHYPTREGESLTARVMQVIGEPDDPRTEVSKIVLCAEIPDRFSEDALAAAARVPLEVRPEDFVDRVDLRDRDFLTIDPETARDHDDAVCVEQRGDGWRLWVAIADVANYVQAGSALDREARSRGTSVYLPDRAIPMLPEALSAGICSLKPEVDRCALCVRLDFDRTAQVTGRLLEAGIIRSRARLDYAGVAAALGGDFRGVRARYRDHADHLHRMWALAKLIRGRRDARGALDFDLPEASVILDDDDPRRVRDVRHAKPSPEIKMAYGIVEDFMISANEAVGAFFRERGLDTVWRVHDVPSIERLEEFAHLAAGFGLHLRPEEGLRPLPLRRFLLEVRGRPMERALSYLLLRSLKQAVYDVTNRGHFGLASQEYLHFTSPIRRYPDLLVQRLLRHALKGEGIPAGGGGAPPPPRAALVSMAAESSTAERRAIEAEREVTDMYRAYLMRDRVGEEYDGVISGLTSFGVFVEVREPFIEGMVRVESLGDGAYDFEEDVYRLRGRRSGRTFSLGDPVRVRVENVSVARRRIDFALITGGTAGPTTPRRRPGEPASSPTGERARQREERRRSTAGDPKDGRPRRKVSRPTRPRGRRR
jgi:ribonuclease R